MSNKEFEQVVLEKLNNFSDFKGEVLSALDGLNGKFDGLEKEMHAGFKRLDDKMDVGFDRLDDKIDDQTIELKQTIRVQGAYLDQAFEHITHMQNRKAKTS